jgi:hypothetical protein
VASNFSLECSQQFGLLHIWFRSPSSKTRDVGEREL